ncbi:MAG: DNA translocase FtsK [Phycisphaerales bacterium]
MADSKRSASSRGKGAFALAGSPLARRIVLILGIAVWAFMLASLVGYDPADPPTHVVWPANEHVTNWCGPVGAYVASTFFKLLGFGAWVLVSFTGLGMLSAACGAAPKHSMVRFVGLVLMSCAVAGVQHLALPSSGSMPDLAGGLIGTLTCTKLVSSIGVAGATLALLGGVMVGAFVAMDEWLSAAFAWIWSVTREHGVPAAKVAGVAAGGVAMDASSAAAKATAKGAGGLFNAFVGWVKGERSSRPQRVKLNDLGDEGVVTDTGVRKARKLAGASPVVAAEEVVNPETGEVTTVEVKKARRVRKKDQLTQGEALVLDQNAVAHDVDAQGGSGPAPATAATVTPPTAAPSAPAEEDEHHDAPQVYTEDQLREKIAKLPILFGQKEKKSATDADLASMQAAIEEGEKYKFPQMDMLEEPEANFNEKLEVTVKEQAEALIKALEQFRIEGEVDSVESGPVITLFHVRLSPGTKVSALETVSKDIARVLKAQNIRIVSNMAGRDTVGIEVPNLEKEKVRLKELMGKTELYQSMKLPMFLGKDASGAPLIEDLTKMPHMLIAGTTGSGKSVCMNTIIMGFLYTKKPSELKMVLVDPKMVEMSQFKDIPHLMCPVVTEMAKAAAILEWATTKMDERYELLAEAGCRDISAYNELTWDELKERLNITDPEHEAKTPRKLPYMVFIIDELADLMMTNKEVENHIIRIAQKARAVGIHLILATQRPQANVVTGLIKSNMPCRIAFKVASGVDSRIVLDQKGGELLLGHGDMLFLSPRSAKLSRAQGTLVDDREIRRVVKFMKEIASPSFERSLIQLRSGGAEGSDEDRILQSQNNSSASLQAAQEDPMFNRAVEIVLETKRGSVSLLQRRLAIGYTRASRLVDLMGIAGIISDHKGSVARDVLITLDDWQRIKTLAQEEAKAKGIVLREEREPGDNAIGAVPPPEDENQELFEAKQGTRPEARVVQDDDAPPFAEDEEPTVVDTDELGDDSYDRGEREFEGRSR